MDSKITADLLDFDRREMDERRSGGEYRLDSFELERLCDFSELRIHTACDVVDAAFASYPDFDDRGTCVVQGYEIFL